MFGSHDRGQRAPFTVPFYAHPLSGVPTPATLNRLVTSRASHRGEIGKMQGGWGAGTGSEIPIGGEAVGAKLEERVGSGLISIGRQIKEVQGISGQAGLPRELR